MASLDSIINQKYEDKKILGSGSFGVVIDNFDGTATKVMRFDTTDPYPIIKIKELNLENFYKISNIFILNNGKNDYLKSYKMDVIKEDDTKLINVPIDFFITNIKILMNSLKILSDNYILSYDLSGDNVIINKEGVFIIDCDLYRYEPEYNKELIYYNNIEHLKKAVFEQLYKDASIFKKRKICKLFNDYDLDTILNNVKDSNSINEYLKK